MQTGNTIRKLDSFITKVNVKFTGRKGKLPNGGTPKCNFIYIYI